MRVGVGIVIVWLAAVHTALAQPAPGIADRYIQRAWGTGDGLPQNTVTSILQTRDGYLWLGTFGGLVRFDGQAFTVFDPANTPGLASARIVTLHEDRDGRLWIGTEGGLSKLEAGRFTTYTTRDGLPEDGIYAVIDDRSGRIWIATGGGLVRFDGRSFSPVSLTEVDEDATPVDLVATANGDVWVATWYAVAQFEDEAVGYFKREHRVMRTLHADPQGRLWLGGSTLALWDGQRFTDVPMPIGKHIYGTVTALASDRSGSVWIGTAKAGVFRWHDGQIEAAAGGNGLSTRFVRSLLVDREDQLWIGTDVGGLERWKPRRVNSYQRPGSVEQSIGPIVGDGVDGLWVGATCGGLLHFRLGRFRIYDERAGMPNGCVWALHRDPDGTLWIGTMGGGLTRYRNGRFDTFDTRHGILGTNVHALVRDRDGVLWVGTNRGLSRFDHDRFTNYTAADGVTGNVLTIMPDRAGGLWLGGLNGLMRFEEGRVTATYTTAQGLSHNHVRAIHRDADGVLWIGTYGGGLNRFSGGRFRSYNPKEGLTDLAVSRIIEDERGDLWMSGNKGVFRVARGQLNDLADGKITYVTSVSYGTADGMITDETNGGQPAGWRAADGTFWFPTISGLVGIDAALREATTPVLAIERVVVNGHDVPPDARTHLGPGRADAEFHYTAIDLGAAEKTRFRYRLLGYDRDWIEAGARRVAYYTNITPGSYRFEVSATDSNGVWTPAPTATGIAVTPFWWQRRGAQAAGLLVLLVASGAMGRFISLRRTRARLAQLERERALERERTRIARDLHDDLGSRLAQIALMAEAPAAARGDHRIGGIAREAMQTMDELVWSVNARNDTVERFAEYAAEYAEEQLSLAGLRYRLQVQPGLDGLQFDADTRRHVFLAFKEALHNVIKHASASEVRIALRVTDGILLLEVADNGRGFAAEHVSATGNGLRNMRERMTAAGGSLGVESRAGDGTRLLFRVPVGGPVTTT